MKKKTFYFSLRVSISLFDSDLVFPVLELNGLLSLNPW